MNYWETRKLCFSLRFLFTATNTEFFQKFIQNQGRLLRTVLPDVVNIYCLIVFPEAKDFPSLHCLLRI